MEQTLTPARTLSGEVTVPGEFDMAAEALVLASLSPEESRIANVPVSINPVVDVVRGLGARVERTDSCLQVKGAGLGQWSTPSATVDLSACGEAGLPLMAALAGQAFVASARVDSGTVELARRLLELLAPMGVASSEETEGVFRFDSDQPLRGAEYGNEEIPRIVKLSLLIAAMACLEVPGGASATGSSCRLSMHSRTARCCIIPDADTQPIGMTPRAGHLADSGSPRCCNGWAVAAIPSTNQASHAADRRYR